MSHGPEFDHVESPFIDQLQKMEWADGAQCWKFTTGNTVDPSATGRGDFREVLLIEDLKRMMRRININDIGDEWLDDGRLTQAVNTLQRLGVTSLTEANEKATELLLKGTTVDGVEGWNNGRAQTIQYIDWENPQNNEFRVINQFQVRCPPNRADKNIRPDLVLLVNGIPLVVIECKRPGSKQGLVEAVEQLKRYSNRRFAEGRVPIAEGNERLFHYAQFQIATNYDYAAVGTFSSDAVHYLAWKDTSPCPMADVATALGKEADSLSQQETLVAGMLHPEHLLDIVRHFTLFMVFGGQKKKIVCRYQQFRAAQLAYRRLLEGKTREEDGELDRRGGVIWHTQGSGKSLTMVFLIRKMRSHAKLRRFKIVVVTDRVDLQVQLSETAQLTGENLTIVQPDPKTGRSSLDVLQDTLSQEGKDFVFSMIQKYRGESIDPAEEDEELSPNAIDEVAAKTKPLPELNTSDEILVMVDEAHRSQSSSLHANLLQALPNAARIGWTGTPIMMGQKKKTRAIFGDFIDTYTIKESEQDGATVRILYEGRTTSAILSDGREVDELFPDMLADYTDEEQEQIQSKYATKSNVLEAPKLIAEKARDMLRHYVENILPNGFKAQVVAVSRRATIRYYEAFEEARDELVDELESLDPELIALPTDAKNELEGHEGFLARAYPYLPTIKDLEFAPVISGGGHNDPVDPAGEWSTRSKIDERIARFKKPLFVDGESLEDRRDPEKTDPLAFLIVRTMLLTGFDAPVEQVMYLDRQIREAELLQAIARVNRTHDGKTNGYVVDYYGVASHLKQALEVYSDADVEGALYSFKDEIPKLRDQHQRLLDLLSDHGIETINATSECVELLRDDKIRAGFQVHLKKFLGTLDDVLPRSEALEFVNDAKQLAYIQAKARNLYRSDERLIGHEVGAKVRKLIDEHVEAQGINTKIPPIAITDADFEQHVDKETSSRAKASEMEHALRHHIRKCLDEDPVYFTSLSKKLQDILTELNEQWDEQVEALRELIESAKEGRKEEDSPVTSLYAPFYALLKEKILGEQEPSEKKQAKIVELTTDIVDHIRQEITIAGFWNKTQARDDLHGWIFKRLDESRLIKWEDLDSISSELMNLAKANRRKLTGDVP